jgi:sugar-phosphatase
VFDKDGVLVDTMGMIQAAWTEWAATRGLDATEVLASIHMTGAELISRFAPSSDPGEEIRWIAARQSAVERSIVAFPGASALLAGLPRDAWAIVTSGRREPAIRHLEIAGLPVPEVLVSAEDTPRGKPDPAGFVLAARRLDVPPQACLAVEDSPAGVQAAVDAGFFVVAVTSTHPASSLINADAVVGSLSEIRLTLDHVNQVTA